MREMKETGIPWLPEVAEYFSVGYVKQYFYVSKDLSNEGEPERVLKLARAGIVEKDVTTNEGQMAASYAGYNKVQVGVLLLNPMDLYSGANCNVSELNGVISPAYSNLRAKKAGSIVPKFYDYYFKCQYWLMAMFAHGKGVSFDNRWTLNNDSLRSYEIPVIPYAVQGHIVERIQSEERKVDALITNMQAQIEKLKAYKQSVITENIAPQDDWRKCRLGQIANFKNGLNYNGLSTAVEIKFLGVGDFHQNFRMDKPEMFSNLRFNGDLPKDLFLQNGDIVFVRSNGSKELVGRSVLIDNVDYPLTYSGFCIRMRNLRKDIIRSEFLMFYFWSHTYRQTLNQNSRGTNISNLTQEMLSALEINFPNIELQDEIVDSLSNQMESIDRLIAIKQAKIEKLEQYKRSLIYEYVTGKKEVR